MVCLGPFKIEFLWYDLWVGAYWDRLKRKLYLAPLPMLVISFYPRDLNKLFHTLKEWIRSL